MSTPRSPPSCCAKWGARVERACNGGEALVRFGDGHFDIVLMDCQMPGMDGFEATVRIRAIEAANQASGAPPRRVPIVALTANALSGDAERCIAVGMDDHLGKPFRRGQLVSVVARWAGAAPEASRPRLPEAIERMPVAPLAIETTPAAIDRTALMERLQIAPHRRPMLISRVIDLFLTQTAEALQALPDKLASGDRASVARTLHTLRSTSASVGAMALSATVAATELTLQHGPVEAALSQVVEIAARFEEAARELGELRDELLTPHAPREAPDVPAGGEPGPAPLVS